jgi:hypothetical protein
MRPICPKSGKQGFDSATDAKASPLSKHNRRRHQPKHAYKCPDCGLWHLTRVPPERINKRRRSA